MDERNFFLSLDQRVQEVLREAVYILLHPASSEKPVWEPFSTVIFYGSPYAGPMAEILVGMLQEAMSRGEPLHCRKHFPHDPAIIPRHVHIYRRTVVKGSGGYVLKDLGASSITDGEHSLSIIDDPGRLVGSYGGLDGRCYNVNVGHWFPPSPTEP